MRTRVDIPLLFERARFDAAIYELVERLLVEVHTDEAGEIWLRITASGLAALKLNLPLSLDVRCALKAVHENPGDRFIGKRSGAPPAETERRS